MKTWTQVLTDLVANEKELEKITVPGDVLKALTKYTKRETECFLVLTLNAANRIIQTIVVTTGLVNRTLIHPREVFRPAISDNAVSIITAHNHPSGKPGPSDEDYKIHERLKQAGNIIGIPIVDNIIVSSTGYYSFMEEGKL